VFDSHYNSEFNDCRGGSKEVIVILDGGYEMGTNETFGYIMNVDGSNAHLLTNETANITVINLSRFPDGSLIAYMHGASILVKDANSSKVIPIVGVAGSASPPVWSPDGTKLAFGWGGMGCSNLYIVNTTDIRNELNGLDYQLPRMLIPTICINGLKRSLTWSPDGLMIAFPSGNRLFAINISDDTLISLAKEEKSYYWSPSWSPNGKYIVWGENNKNSVAVATLDLNAPSEFVALPTPTPSTFHEIFFATESAILVHFFVITLATALAAFSLIYILRRRKP
jgi:Tol biopolymer transport system component